MKQLTLAFLKIFFRNRSTIFFVIFLPALIFLAFVFLSHRGVIILPLLGRYDDFLLAGLLAFALMQAGVYTAGYTLLDYRRRQVLKRFSVSPLSADTFLWAQVFARFSVALLQTAVLLLLGFFVFHIRISGGVVFLPFVIFLGCSIFLNFGFLIAALARDYEQAAIYTSVIGLASSFLGDVFFPIERLSSALTVLSKVLPLRPLSLTFRFFLFGTDRSEVLLAIAVLLAWFSVSTVAAKYIFVRKAYR